MTRWRLTVDPIACDGRGLCAALLPGDIVLDDWGYPIVTADPLAADRLGAARRAVALCPTLALRLERHAEPSPSPAHRAAAASRPPH